MDRVQRRCVASALQDLCSTHVATRDGMPEAIEILHHLGKVRRNAPNFQWTHGPIDENSELVGDFNNLEKYEFVNGKDDIPYIVET